MEKIYNEIISFLKEYQERTSVKGYVLGISGGKDSTVVARLLCDAIGKENVLGIRMPNGIQHDLDIATSVCRHLDIDSLEVNIQKAYKHFLQEMYFYYNGDIVTEHGKTFQITDKAKTNIAPRIRMATLYAIGQSLGYRIAGTGNASEQYIGWFTKWGDGVCDVNPIAHLTCTEVIQLGDYLGLPYDLIHKVPEDGLTKKSDEENFGFTYDVLDHYIRSISFESPIEDIEKIHQLHNASYHKTKVITINNK